MSYEPHDNDLLGAVCHNRVWRLFAGTVGEWILDYYSYDDSFSLDQPFRGNLYVVETKDGEAFLRAMAPYEVAPETLTRTSPEERKPLTFVVNFDTSTYVNGYFDLALEDHVPEGWNSTHGDPVSAVPEQLRRLWT